MKDYDLINKIAVITGGAKGIGRAIGQRLARHGAKVVIWDLTVDDLPAGWLGFASDVADCHSVTQAQAQTIKSCERIDILVNCAGFSGPTQPFVDYDLEVWQSIIDVNLYGTVYCCKQVLPGMINSGWGRIINIASLAGKEGTPNASAYSTAKAGVIGFTKSLGKELAQSGVLVNCLAPAAIDTDILKQMSAQHVQTMIDKSPMKRLGTIEEVAALVSWLASEEASFNTGAVFDLSGGRATY